MNKLALLCVLSAFAGVIPDFAAAGDAAFVTQAGKPVAIGAGGSHVIYGAYCTSGPAAQITITSGPANGSTTVRRVATAGGKTVVGSTYDCSAQKTLVTVLIYTPRQGFRGVDRVSFKTSTHEGQYPMFFSTDATITVK